MCFIFSSSFSFLSFSGACLLLRERQQFQDLQLTCFCVNWRTWNCCRFSYRNKNLDPSARHVIMIKFYAFYRKEMNMILTLLADGLRFLLRYDFLRASGSSSKTLDWRFFSVNWRTWNRRRFSDRNKNLDPSAIQVIMIKFDAFYRKELNMILTLLADGSRFLLRSDFRRASAGSSKTLDWYKKKRFFLCLGT